MLPPAVTFVEMSMILKNKIVLAIGVIIIVVIATMKWSSNSTTSNNQEEKQNKKPQTVFFKLLHKFSFVINSLLNSSATMMPPKYLIHDCARSFFLEVFDLLLWQLIYILYV